MSGKARQLQKILLFRLQGTRLFGLGTLKIREILPFQRLTRLPHSHPAVLGTAMFRGIALPVVDMAAAAGYPPLSPQEQAQGSIIITDIQRRNMGFLVRSVQRIVEVDWSKVSPPPGALGTGAFITGLLDLDGEIVQLLDVELLLARVYPDTLIPGKVALSDLQRETLRSLNILLVDDSQVARKQLCDALDQEGIGYQVTSHGGEALQTILQDHEQGQPVDILVSDIEMPGLDGYELAFKVRDNASLKQPYIILHTSLNSEMSVSYAHQVGANEALTKFDAQELLQAMLRGAGAGHA